MVSDRHGLRPSLSFTSASIITKKGMLLTASLLLLNSVCIALQNLARFGLDEITVTRFFNKSRGHVYRLPSIFA